MSAMPPSAKTTPCSERARKQRDHPRNHHPQQTQAAQTLQQLRRRPPPPWRQAQAGPARNHKTRLTAPLSPTETASFRARQPRPLARPGYADQSRPAPQQRVSKSQNRSLERVDPRRDQDSDHINKHGITLVVDQNALVTRDDADLLPALAVRELARQGPTTWSHLLLIRNRRHRALQEVRHGGLLP